MLQNEDSKIKMAINNCSKKIMNPPNHLDKIFFYFITMLFPCVLSAQIKITEEIPTIEDPAWWEFKDIVYAPYDSSYLYVKNYPILDAYKKYIGQQLYLPSLYQKGCGTRGNALLLFCNDNSTNHTWHPISTRGYKNNENEEKEVINKYYKIIDVLSLVDAEFKEHTKQVNCNSWMKKHVELCNGYSFSIKYENKNIVPYFVLIETQSKDTVYTLYPESFILVGGFVKIQQKLKGHYIFQLLESPSHDNINKNIIKEKWLCNDVSLKIPTNGTYDNDLTIYLEMNDVDDDSIKKKLDYNKIDEIDFFGNYGEYWSEIQLETTLEKIKKEENLREKEDAEYKRRLAQKKVAYKQELISRFGIVTAEKIIAGKYEIGMSKQACKEIAGFATVIDASATTETWRIVNIFENSIYLYFTNDKLVRIAK